MRCVRNNFNHVTTSGTAVLCKTVFPPTEITKAITKHQLSDNKKLLTVSMILTEHMVMLNSKYLPIIGTLRLVAGMISVSRMKNTAKLTRILRQNCNF